MALLFPYCPQQFQYPFFLPHTKNLQHFQFAPLMGADGLPFFILLVCVSYSRSCGLEDAFQHSWDNLSIHAFSPFALLRQILLRVLVSRNLIMILIAPLWPQKEWFADFSLLLWKFLLSSPCFGICWCSPMRESFMGLELLKLHTWKLSNDSFTRQDIVRRLQRSPLWISGNPQYVSAKESGPDSSIVVIEGILLSCFP